MVFTGISFAYFGGKRKEEERKGRNGKHNAEALQSAEIRREEKNLTRRNGEEVENDRWCPGPSTTWPDAPKPARRKNQATSVGMTAKRKPRAQAGVPVPRYLFRS